MYVWVCLGTCACLSVCVCVCAWAARMCVCGCAPESVHRRTAAIDDYPRRLNKCSNYNVKPRRETTSSHKDLQAYKVHEAHTR
jgi:hypothetical protein